MHSELNFVSEAKSCDRHVTVIMHLISPPCVCACACACACVCVCVCVCSNCHHSPSSLNKVFHVPMEERRRDLHKPFGGESTQAQIVRDVMSKTNCHIEICEARDHSLSIMVTGKAEGVILARKEILKKLQTQVCACMHAVCMLCVCCVCACMCAVCVCACMRACVCPCMSGCACMCSCMRVCMRVLVCTCTGFTFLEILSMSVVQHKSTVSTVPLSCVGSTVRCIENITLPEKRYGYCRLKIIKW